MFGIRTPISVVVSALLANWPACADAQTAEPATPGIIYQGRFIGFVPAHLKADRKRALSAADHFPQSNQAEFVWETDQQVEVLPEAAASPVADELVEGPKACFAEGIHPPLAQPLAAVPGDTLCLWGGAEFLLWWTRGMETPPLATTSPDGVPVNQAGVLGQPGAAVLFGGNGLNDEARSGGRFTLGAWLDPRRRHGLQASYLYLGSETSSFSASDDDLAILARPFFNVQNNAQDARRIAFPGDVSGSLDIRAETQFQAFEALYRVSRCNAPRRGVNFVLGYRFAELEDEIAIRELTQALAAPIAGTTFDLADDFNTRNSFHGGQLGMVVACRQNTCWSWEAAAKVALGSTTSRASVLGQTTTTAGGASATTPAGLLAQSTNIGRYEHSGFSTLSELDITLRRRVTCGLSLSLGYSFLYWTDVARAGEQIDLGVNPSQIPPGMLVGPARPAFSFEHTDFWAQGLRFGIDYAY